MDASLSLKEVLQKDIAFLDAFFKEVNDDQLNVSWTNVREAAISFTEIFEKVQNSQ